MRLANSLYALILAASIATPSGWIDLSSKGRNDEQAKTDLDGCKATAQIPNGDPGNISNDDMNIAMIRVRHCMKERGWGRELYSPKPVQSPCGSPDFKPNMPCGN